MVHTVENVVYEFDNGRGFSKFDPDRIFIT